jgi:hypothetical protein
MPSPDDTAYYRRYKEGLYCYYSDSLNSKERLKIYPFNKAKRIELISYRPVRNYDMDSSYVEPGGLPIINNQIDLKKIYERVVLSKSQVDSLTSLLFNVKSKWRDIAVIEHLACDCPCMNAILFFNNRSNCFAYIGICFEGPDFFVSQPEIENKIGDFCIGKYDLIKEFFKQSGILYGLDSTYLDKK